MIEYQKTHQKILLERIDGIREKQAQHEKILLPWTKYTIQNLYQDDIALLHFLKDYKTVITTGIEGQRGMLKINNIPIKISSKYCDICVTLANKIKKDWFKEDKLKDAGWVSFEGLINKVEKWREDHQTEPIDDKVIINSIYNLNKKIRTELSLDENLIENGNDYGWPGHYRFRVHPDYVSVE